MLDDSDREDIEYAGSSIGYRQPSAEAETQADIDADAMDRVAQRICRAKENMKKAEHARKQIGTSSKGKGSVTIRSESDLDKPEAKNFINA